MTSSTKKRPILVAGGGIGGFAAALCLARSGHPIQLFEQAQEIKEIGAGIQIGPNAFHVFERLGLVDEITSKASLPERLVMRDALNAEEVTSIPLLGEFRERFKYPYALIHRADLHRVFVDACTAEPNIEVVTATKVQGFTQSDELVTLHTDSGDYTGAALIGADGLWSTIRQQIVGDGPPRVSGHIAYRAVLPVTEVPEELRSNTMTLWAGPKNHLVQYHLRGDELVNLVAVFHSDKYVEGWDTKGDKDELYKRFSNSTPQVKALLEKIDSWRMWVLCDRDPVKNWAQGNVVLLGDAAHPMLQYMAQGACMAMEDAVVLDEELKRDPTDFAAAFVRYQDRRYLRTGKVQMSARLYGEFYHAAGVNRELRNEFLRSRSLRQTLDGMAWLYNGI